MEEKNQLVLNSSDVMLQTMFNTQLFEQAQRAGKLFSESGLVPQSFNKNPAACFIGLQLASQLNINPLMLFQHIYQVNGKLGIEAQIAIGIANKSGVFKGPIKYEFKGEGKTRSCTARAILANSGEEISMTVDWETVEKEGWHKKTGSKWNTMPDLMFRYRSAMWLIRAYVPETILGLSSSEELADVIDVTPKKQAKTIDQAINELKAKEEPKSIEPPKVEEAVVVTAEAEEVKPAEALKALLDETFVAGSKEELEKLMIKPQMLTVYSMKILKKNVKIADMTEEEAAKILDYIRSQK